MFSLLRDFLLDEEGQTAVEYFLLIALSLSLLIAAFAASIGVKALTDWFSGVTGNARMTRVGVVNSS